MTQEEFKIPLCNPDNKVTLHEFNITFALL